MQKMTRIYENHIAVDIAEKGWCLLQYRIGKAVTSLWEKGNCLVFYPYDFVPDSEFGEKLEKLCRKIFMRMLWIENPEAETEFWKLTAGTWEYPYVRLGKYWIYCKEPIRESDSELVFRGRFGVGGESLPLSGETVTLSLDDTLGVLSFEFSVKSENFSALDAGIRYHRLLSSDTEHGEEKNYTESFAGEVLLPEGEISICGKISPAMIWNHQVSFFKLPVCNWTSTFLTPQGTAISMVSEDGAMLVFERSADLISYDSVSQTYFAAGISWYLGIEGDFSLNSGDPMMLGLKGTEYISDVRRFRFRSNQCGILRMEKEEEEERTLYAGDSCIVTAPWISIQGTYHSSSASMPFFSGKDGFIRNYVPKIQDFQVFTEPFPVMPWSGLHFLPENFDATEAENLLLQKRFQILTKSVDLSEPGGEEEQLLVTPCGTCAAIEPESSNWNWVGIAQIDGKEVPDVRLKNPALPVRAALQKTDCILTAFTLESFQKFSETELNLSFRIDGWNICFSEETWTEYSLFMIKYSKSASIRSLLEGSIQLKHVLEQAYDSHGEVRKGFQPLVEIMDDTEFQGVLMLGGLAEAKVLSPELKAVLAFTGEAGLPVVYTAISNGRVTADGSGFSVAKSNVNALVLYEGVPEQRSDGVPFAFCTREMTVFIEQSRLRYFHSRSELSLYRLFGAALNPAEEKTGSALVMTGRLEEVNGQQTYRFLLDSPVTFGVSDSALESVTVQDVVMSAGEEMLRFLLRGQQKYKMCDNFDLFSYDKIGFGGVSLIMESDQPSIDYGGYEFYEEDAVIRDHSFVEAFGAPVKELVCDVFNRTPEAMGYLSINAPIKQGVLGEGWSGIVWQIFLNSSGQLGRNEPLYFELLAGWSGNSYYVGIKTGGIFGKSFSLQGIITAGFTGITMEAGKKGKVYLHLHSFAIKVLGLSFPQRGADVYILGEQGKAAWYAAYDDGGNENGEL